MSKSLLQSVNLLTPGKRTMVAKKSSGKKYTLAQKAPNLSGLHAGACRVKVKPGKAYKVLSNGYVAEVKKPKKRATAKKRAKR